MVRTGIIFPFISFSNFLFFQHIHEQLMGLNFRISPSAFFQGELVQMFSVLAADSLLCVMLSCLGCRENPAAEFMSIDSGGGLFYHKSTEVLEGIR